MRIAILYSHLSETGGAERVLLAEARVLKEKGHRVTCYFAHLNQSIAASSSIPLRVLPGLSILSRKAPQIIMSIPLAPVAARVAKESDILICHGYGPAIVIGYVAKKLYGARYLSYIHSPPRFLYLSEDELSDWTSDETRRLLYLLGRTLRPLAQRIDRKALLASDLILANSNYTASRLKRIYGCEVGICYPPAELPIVEGRHNVSTGFQNGHYPVILTTGRLVRIKRYDLLIRALAAVKERFGDVLLLVVGESEARYRSDLQALAENLGVDKNVSFLGRRDDESLAQLYGRADVYAYAVPGEDFGLGPVEAMSFGTPAVVWADGAGPSETVIDGVTGFKARPYDTRDFALRLVDAAELKRNIGSLTLMGRQGGRFSAETHVDCMLKGVGRVLSG